MADTTWLDWPFFDDRHRALAGELEAWCVDALADIDHHDTDAACRQQVASLGRAGWLRYCVPAGPDGGWGGGLPQGDCRLVDRRRGLDGKGVAGRVDLGGGR